MNLTTSGLVSHLPPSTYLIYSHLETLIAFLSITMFSFCMPSLGRFPPPRIFSFPFFFFLNLVAHILLGHWNPSQMTPLQPSLILQWDIISPLCKMLSGSLLIVRSYVASPPTFVFPVEKDARLSHIRHSYEWPQSFFPTGSHIYACNLTGPSCCGQGTIPHTLAWACSWLGPMACLQMPWEKTLAKHWCAWPLCCWPSDITWEGHLQDEDENTG